MTCRACEELLQLHLDGVASPGDLERHLYACPTCAVERLVIERLLDGISRLRPPAVPPDVTERLVAAALAESAVRPEPAWRRHALAAGFSLAASVVVAITAWAWWPIAPPLPSISPAVVAAPPSPLRDSVAEAQLAVAALTSRTASETVETTSRLLPSVALDPMEPTAPAVEPLLAASSGVGAAVAPVADSARRAVGLFLRDLPVARAPGDKNPG
ncbi:MAG: hypothetical protein U0797_02035 [Gemmataceae bacterium]